jgi:hypothetical protein
LDDTGRLEFDFKLAEIGDRGVSSIKRAISCGGSRPHDDATANDRCRDH